MPEMDGFEVARIIRGHPNFERTPIVFITGMNVSEFDRLKGYQVGAIDYMIVPIIPEILRSKVSVFVELHQQRNELLAANRALEDARARLTVENGKAIADKEAHRRAVFEHPSDLIIVLEAIRDDSGAITDWVYRNANGNALRCWTRRLSSLSVGG